MKYCDVLIIDDDTDDIEFLTASLTECGVGEVHFVHSSEEALFYLNKVFPDCIPRLIMCDFFLITGNAVDFATKFREMVTHNHVILMVWSGSHSDIQKENLVRLEVLDYHPKPTSIAEFRMLAELMKDRIGA